MASAAGAPVWLRGKVKAVPSGDCLLIMASSKAEIPLEKTITLSSLMAPRLARRGGVDEPFAWDSREFLRKLCIGKEVTFKVEYTVQSIGRDFGSVFLGDKNVGLMVVAAGWAKVREQGQQKGEASPFLSELIKLEEQAQQQGLGRWNSTPGAAEASIRDLPPSAVGGPGNFDAMELLNNNKGLPLKALVEHVRDGSTLRVYLLPEFQFVQVFTAGVQAPSMGRRAAPETVKDTVVVSSETDGDSSKEASAPLTSAQRLSVSKVATNDVSPDPFAREAKHFTEIRVLNRDVRIVLEGVDKFSNLIGSVYYPEGDFVKELSLELVEHGLAKYVEWSASLLEDETKRRLKTAELQAKKSRLRCWTNYIPPPSNSKAIHNQNFTGKVIEVVSGDCLIVADESLPFGDPSAERRINISSIRAPKMGNPRKVEKIAPFARESKEFLRTRVIGRQVNVSMEYSRKVTFGDGAASTAPSDSKVMDFGSVFLPSSSKDANHASGNQPAGVNIAELLVSRGFATVVRHRDFDERSNHYDALLAAESRAISGKKGVHSIPFKDPPVMHITDLTTASGKKAREFLPSLQRHRRIEAVVEYVLSGHRFRLFIPKETCSIAFSLSGVRCPGRDEPHSNEAIAFMRRKIMQRDVEIEVETVDRNGTFLGSVWESRNNVALPLLEAGLAKFQASFGSDKIPDAHHLMQAEQFAKRQKLKIWENFVEGQEVSSGPVNERKQKEELKVGITEVMGGGKFYYQSITDPKVAVIEEKIASLNLQEGPVLGSFNPKKGEIVLAQYSGGDSWNRAMIVNAPRGAVETLKDEFEVFYIDYGNQEIRTYSQLRPLDNAISATPPLAQLCSFAHVKIPDLENDYGQDALDFLKEHVLYHEFRAVIEERDSSGEKVKEQGTGTIFMVTLFPLGGEGDLSMNAVLVQEGLARLERRKRWGARNRHKAMVELEKYQAEAIKEHIGMWEFGDIQSDDEDSGPPARKPTAGKK